MRQLLIFFTFISISIAKKLPDIYWNSTNPLVERFAAIGDTLDIYCPSYDSEVHPSDTEQTIIYRVPESDYETCRLSSEAQELRRCVRPYEKERWTASFRTFNPSPSALHYTPGETYYFISTSSGSAAGLHNSVGGLCASHNLKMIIHVTSRNGNIAGGHGHRHHHHHHKTTTTTQATTSTTRRQPQEEKKQEVWPENPLWGEFIEKVSRDNAWPRREPSRASRVSLDSGNEKDLYEALPLEPAYDRMEYLIHEIGEVDSLFSSTSTSCFFIPLVLLLTLLLLRL